MADPSHLTDNASSEYASLFHHFSSTGAKAIAYAYVEADEDKPYWRAVLRKYGSSQVEYRVETLRDSNPGEATGCDRLYKYAEQAATGVLGRNKFICTDADLHLLVNHNSHTATARSHPYVVNTTYYSIENILISPHYLNLLLQKLGIPDKAPELLSLIEDLSKSCADSFLLWLAYHDEPPGHRGYVKSDFNNYMNSYPACLMNAAHTALIANKSARISQIRNLITGAGCHECDWWKLYRGHTLLETVILNKITKLVTDDIRDQLKRYRAAHTGAETAAEQERLHRRFSGFPSIRDYIAQLLYNVEPDPAWTPAPTHAKIRQITGP